MSAEIIALDKGNQKKLIRSTKRLKSQLKSGEIKLKRDGKKEVDDEEEKRGLVYLGHLPHGFYEDELTNYFKQFGRVTNVIVCRSRKTGQSKGFGYVEFQHPEVAKIAAETMNNYVMFKKRIIAEYVPKEKRPRKIFHGKRSTPGHVSVELRRERQRIAREKPVDEETHKTKCEVALSKLDKKLKRLNAKGIKCELKPVNMPKGSKSKSEIKLKSSLKSKSVLKSKSALKSKAALKSKSSVKQKSVLKTKSGVKSKSVKKSPKNKAVK